jgi:hypothetical protein
MCRVVGGRSNRVDDGQYIVSFDQLAREFHRLRSAVAIVEREKRHFAAIDARLRLVEKPEMK